MKNSGKKRCVIAGALAALLTALLFGWANLSPVYIGDVTEVLHVDARSRIHITEPVDVMGWPLVWCYRPVGGNWRMRAEGVGVDLGLGAGMVALAYMMASLSVSWVWKKALAACGPNHIL